MGRVRVAIGVGQRKPVPTGITACRIQFPHPHRPAVVLGSCQEHVSGSLVGLSESWVGGVAALVQGSVPQRGSPAVGQPQCDYNGILGDLIYGRDNDLSIPIQIQVSEKGLGCWFVPAQTAPCVWPHIAANHQRLVAP